ncbi:MAG: RNA ligase family protein [Myxococcaceae bacterium]|nr:RNA ligase family protein [Myxococcaceae bacterium]
MPITTYPSLVYGTRYPAIPHLHGSAFTDGDVVLSEAQTRAVLRRRFVAYEKLDGLNVGLSFRDQVPVVHSRVHGVVPLARLGPTFWPLVDFIFDRLDALWQLLGDRYAVFGEWLEGAPARLRYPRRDVPFVGFDLVDLAARTFLGPGPSHRRLREAGFAVPEPVFQGTARSVEALWPLTRRSRFGGPAEGLVLVQGARCFKLVRDDYLDRPVLPRPTVRAPLPRRFERDAHVTKRFGDTTALAVEADRLRAAGALGPGLVATSGRTLVMRRLPGRPPRGSITSAQAAAIGRSLNALHRRGTRVSLASLEASATDHLRRALALLQASGDAGSKRWARALRERLLPLVRRLEHGLERVEVVCHGDLKREHVRIDARGAVRFLDFERALVADAAWEVGAAFERLELSPRARVALCRAMGDDDGTRMLRAWLYRLVWWVLHPVALRGERRTEPVERFLRDGEARARALLEALGAGRLPQLR